MSGKVFAWVARKAESEASQSSASEPVSLGTATVRSGAYALFSRLVTSPHDLSGEGGGLPPSDLGAVLHQLEEGLPYPTDFSTLAAVASTLAEVDGPRLARAYSALFEVGSEGPPLTLREGLSAKAATGVREEIVRFYEFFNFKLRRNWCWAPDHLAVELEFLHLLAFAESNAKEPGEAQSYQRAQIDFLARHPLTWVPPLMAEVQRRSPEPYWCVVFDNLVRFLCDDHAFQQRNLEGRA